ncbi:hypothetical protein [Bacteroides hominis]
MARLCFGKPKLPCSTQECADTVLPLVAPHIDKANRINNACPSSSDNDVLKGVVVFAKEIIYGKLFHMKKL